MRFSGLVAGPMPPVAAFEPHSLHRGQSRSRRLAVVAGAACRPSRALRRRCQPYAVETSRHESWRRVFHPSECVLQARHMGTSRTSSPFPSQATAGDRRASYSRSRPATSPECTSIDSGTTLDTFSGRSDWDDRADTPLLVTFYGSRCATATRAHFISYRLRSKQTPTFAGVWFPAVFAKLGHEVRGQRP